MTSFIVKLADIPVQIWPVHREMAYFLRDYRSAEEPRFEIRMEQADIDAERQRDREERQRDGRPPFSGGDDRYLETLALYRKLAERMLREDVILFHGSAIEVDGEAYLFTARSGTGKSTHSRLWREHFGDRAVMINDDKPLLRVTEEGVTVYGTPWNGKHHLGENRSAPLKAICILSRAQENRIRPVTAEDAFPALFQQCYLPRDGEELPRVLELLERLSRKVRLYRLGCNMEKEAALVSYQGMQERDQKDEIQEERT